VVSWWQPGGPLGGGNEVVPHLRRHGRRSSSSLSTEGLDRLVEGGPPHCLVGHGMGSIGP
jgi:hypothetical protein